MNANKLVGLNRRLGASTGWQLKRYVPDILEARLALIDQISPDLIIDGGANCGQWSTELRRYVTDTPILAFEPVKESFDVLSHMGLRNFTAVNTALSDFCGKSTINVSGPLGMASSMGEANDFYKKLYLSVKSHRVEEIITETLDSVSGLDGKSLYLKLDVEGHEWQALQGASDLLNRGQIRVLEIETSINVTRAGEKTHYELVTWLSQLGFVVYHLFTPAVSKHGKMNFIDCILTRDDFD